MKQLIIYALLLLLAFTPPEKKYTFVFNDAQLNLLWNVIDNSAAPHDQVKMVEGIIQAQLKSQLDSVKIKTDSTTRKK